MRAFLALPLALVLAGCARYPADGEGAKFTRLTFRFTLADKVNPAYIYAVAIRTFATNLPDDLTHGPVPVVAANDTSSGSRNGFVAGHVDRVIRYDTQATNRYYVFRVRPSSDPNDMNDIDPSPVVEVLDNSGINPDDPPADVPANTLGFTIDVRDLADDRVNAQSLIKSVQFNIIATNRALIGAGDASGRGIDAIGDQRTLFSDTLNNPVSATLVSSSRYTDARSSVPEGTQDIFGVYQPSIDIKSWSLEVDRR